MFELIVSPLLVGLSSGLFCLSYCLPFFTPYLIAEKRRWQQNFKILITFIFGRLLGYLTFGAIVGYLGDYFKSSYINILANLSLLIMAVILILFALNIIKFKNKSLCPWRFSTKKIPLLLGIFLGFNLCPPFLFALNLVFTYQSVWRGIIFFSFFFLGTTIYLIPLLFFTPLSYIKDVRHLSRWAALLIGVIYCVYEIFYFYRAIFIFKIF